MINQHFRFISKYRLYRLLTLLLIQMFLPRYHWFDLLVCTSFISRLRFFWFPSEKFSENYMKQDVLPYKQIMRTGNLLFFPWWFNQSQRKCYPITNCTLVVFWVLKTLSNHLVQFYFFILARSHLPRTKINV